MNMNYAERIYAVVEEKSSKFKKQPQNPMKIITELLKVFINVPADTIDYEITKTLELLANNVSEVDRCALYLLSNNMDTISNTHEWVKDEKYSRMTEQQVVPIDITTFYTNFFSWVENLSGQAPKLLDEGNIAEKEIAKSQLGVPITYKKKVIGVLELSSFRKERTWSKSDMSFITLIGDVLVTAIDRKKMEVAMFKSENFYKRIMGSIPVGLLMFKLSPIGKLIFTDLNPAADSIMNMVAHDSLGKDIEDALPFLANSGIDAILKKIAKEGTTWFSDEFPIMRDGVNLIYEVNAFQIAQDEVAVALIDVTERKEIEKLLAIENEKLKDIDKMRKDFVSMTTHELKTPLSSMIGASEFLISYYKDLKDEEVLDFIEMIHRGSMRLKTMINDLLAVHRFEENKLVLDKEDADVVDIVKRVIKDTSFLFKKRNQELSYELPENCMVNIDPFKIEQVLTNLIHNACKNTPPGGKILIRVQQNDDVVLISVVDSGVGLTSEEIGKLFEKFGKLPRQDVDLDIEMHGTGLGLFISKQIVEAHDGKIWAESEGRGKGSTFTFTIPINPSPERYEK